MNDIIQDIDYKIDLFALFMLLGIGQGLFLSFIFLLKKRNKNKADSYMGLLLIFSTLIIIQHFLNYTKYIVHVIYLFSSTNSLPFIIAPLFFFFIYTHLYGNNIKWKFAHFIPFILYFVYYFIAFNIQSNDVKFNAYIYSHNIDLQPIENVSLTSFLPKGILQLQNYYDLALIIQFGIYLVIGIFYYLKYIKENKLNYFIIKKVI